MKATLEFDLNDPDDRMEHFRCVKSLDMAIVLFEILHNTKKGICNTVEGKNITDPYEAVEMVMDKIWDDVKEHGINMDELIN
jgi:hypothetical protein